MFDLSPLWSIRLVALLLWLLFVVLFVSKELRRRRKRRRQQQRTSKCPALVGRVERILDGALVAADACRTGGFPEPAPFIARFVLSTPQGRILVEPSPSFLVDLDEVDVGDWIEIQGPLEATDADAYRGGSPGQVFRGTDECPLEIRRAASPPEARRPPRAAVALEPTRDVPLQTAQEMSDEHGSSATRRSAER